MKIESSQITKYTLTELDRLDPVTIILEDLGNHQGKLTIDCYGKAWTCYWGAMGCDSVLEFMDFANVDYIADRLNNVPTHEIDYALVSETIGCDVDRDSLAFAETELVKQYGYDWYMNLPECLTNEYRYLTRIVEAVKDAVKELLAEPVK